MAPSAAASGASSARTAGRRHPPAGSSAKGTKRRKVAAEQCEACGQPPRTANNPNGVLWHETEKQGAATIPMGSRCAGCVELHEQQLSHMEWDAVAKHCGDEDSPHGKQIALVRRIRNGDAKVDFEQACVKVHQKIGLRSERQVILFTHAGYTSYFGKVPSQSNKALFVTQPKEDGTGEERCWVFSYTPGEAVPKKGRLATLSVETTVSIETQKLPAAQHLYQEQAWKRLAQVVSQQGNVKSIKSQALHSIADETAKVAKGGAMTKRATAGGDGVSDSEVEVVSSRQEAGSGAAASASAASGPQALGEAPPRSVPEPSSAAMPAMTPRKDGPQSQLGGLAEADVRSLAGGYAKSVFGDRTPKSVGGETQAMSEDGDGGPSDAEAEEGTDAQSKARERIKSLPIAGILLGERKGNQERRANELLGRLDSHKDVAEYSSLTAHLKLVGLAKNLAPRLLKHVDDDTVALSCAELMRAKVAFPPKTQLAITLRRANALQEEFLKNPSDHAWRALFAVVRPLCDPDEEPQEFDATAPVLRSVGFDTGRRMSEFISLAFQRCLVRLLSLGGAGALQAVSMAKASVPIFERWAELDLPDSNLEKLMSCLGVWRTIIAVMDDRIDTLPITELDTYTEAATFTQEVSSQTTNKSIQAIVGGVMVQNAFWRNLLQRFLDTRLKTLEHKPSIEAAMAQLGGLEIDSSDVETTLESVVKNLAVWRERLRLGVYSSAQKLLKEKLVYLVKGRLDGGAPLAPVGKEQLMATSSLLQEASIVFPEDREIADLVAACAVQSRTIDSDLKNRVDTDVCQQMVSGDVDELATKSMELQESLVNARVTLGSDALAESAHNAMVACLGSVAKRLCDPKLDDKALSSVQELGVICSEFGKDGDRAAASSLSALLTRARQLWLATYELANMKGTSNTEFEGLSVHDLWPKASKTNMEVALYKGALESNKVEEIPWAADSAQIMADLCKRGQDTLEVALAYSEGAWERPILKMADELKLIAGWLSEGADWDAELQQDWNFDKIFEHGKATLLRADNEGDTVSSLTAKLVEEHNKYTFWCDQFRRTPSAKIQDVVPGIIAKARTTELCAVMFVLYDASGHDKIKLRANWRAPVARFLSWGVGSMPGWLASRYDAAVKLR